MEEPRINISYNDNPVDICDDVAMILDFLCETLSWTTPGKGIDLTPNGISGLWKILNGCSETLKRIE